MNKELKEQARKEFDEKFSKLRGLRPHLDFEDVWLFIDSLIDKTVQSTEERIAEMIREYAEPYENSTWLNELNAQKVISLITNKNNINKECNNTCGYEQTYGFVPEADCPIHDIDN